jgi:hypothetical protein
LVSDDRVGMVLALVCGGGGVCPFVVFILALFESRVVLPSGHAFIILRFGSSTREVQRQDRVTCPSRLICFCTHHNSPPRSSPHHKHQFPGSFCVVILAFNDLVDDIQFNKDENSILSIPIPV